MQACSHQPQVYDLPFICIISRSRSLAGLSKITVEFMAGIYEIIIRE